MGQNQCLLFGHSSIMAQQCQLIWTLLWTDCLFVCFEHKEQHIMVPTRFVFKTELFPLCLISWFQFMISATLEKITCFATLITVEVDSSVPASSLSPHWVCSQTHLFRTGLEQCHRRCLSLDILPFPPWACCQTQTCLKLNRAWIEISSMCPFLEQYVQIKSLSLQFLALWSWEVPTDLAHIQACWEPPPVWIPAKSFAATLASFRPLCRVTSDDPVEFWRHFCLRF